MAYFAKLDNDNKVIGVQSVNNDVLLDENNVEQEQKGIDLLQSLFGGDWKKLRTIHIVENIIQLTLRQAKEHYMRINQKLLEQTMLVLVLYMML